MAKHLVLKDDTSRIEYIFVQNSSVTTGAGLTGLVFNSAGLTAYYARTQGAATAITLATQTVTGAYSSGGFVEVDATNMPGIYRLDVPNAVFATGVDKAVLLLKGATNMAPVTLEYQLVSFDPENATTLGLTNLDAAVSSRMATYTQPTGFLAATFPAGTVANTTNITAGTVTTATNVTTVNGLAANTVTAAAMDADVITDIWQGTALTEAYATDGATATPAQLLYMIWSLLAELNQSGTTLTAKKLDGTTTSMTFTINSATAPTTITRAT